MTQLRVALWLAVSSEAQAKEDKASLKEQERVGREWVAKQPGAKIVKVFYWDGYSRSETDVLTAYEEFAAQGRYEYHELRQMWQQRAFDVLWVYVHDRIARSPALYAQVMSNVVRSGARIYSASDGWIDEANVDTFIAIGGFSASGDIRKLVKRREMGMRQRLREGKSTTSGIPMTHVRARDPLTGKELALIVDERKRRLFDDAAALVLEGVPWHFIERELYERFGHATSAGKPYAPARIYSMMMHPATWGHNAMRYRPSEKGKAWASFGDWIFEPGHEIPPGVLIEYNVLPPVYPEALALQLQTEIRFRMTNVRGHASSKGKQWFTGLCVCDECGYYLSTYYTGKDRWRKPALKCKTHWYIRQRGDCSQRASLRERDLRQWFTARLAELLESGTPLISIDSATPPPVDPRAGLREDIASLEREIRAMIRKQASTATTDDLTDLYEVEIQEASALLTIRKERLAALEHTSLLAARRGDEQAATLSMLREVGTEKFWELDAPTIRSALRALLQGMCLSVRDGEIYRLVSAPSTNGR